MLQIVERNSSHMDERAPLILKLGLPVPVATFVGLASFAECSACSAYVYEPGECERGCPRCEGDS